MNYSGGMSWANPDKSRTAMLSFLGLLAAWLCLGLLIRHLIWGPAGIVANRELRKRIQATETEIERLKWENGRLRKEIEYRRSVDYLDELARTDLRRVFPGETMILLPTPTASDSMDEEIPDGGTERIPARTPRSP